MSLSTILLLHVSSALSPPKTNEQEYYATLSLPKYASPDDIRNAYRQINRRLKCNASEANKEETAAEYKRLKEAYQVLGDARNRQRYHLLQCHPARYQKLYQTRGPVVVYENLTLACGLIVLVCQPILVAGKVNSLAANVGRWQEVEWVRTLSPTWAIYGLLVLFWLVLVAFERTCRGALTILAFACHHVSLWVGLFLMAQRWDGTRGANWHVLSIPFYLAIALRTLCSLRVVLFVRGILSKMVSPEFLEREKARISDMDDRQKVALEEKYSIVTVDSQAAAQRIHVLSMEREEPVSEQAHEVIRVESSPEFKEIHRAITSLLVGAANVVVFGVMFITLVACKVEGQISASWWAVFTPIWVYLGARLLYSLAILRGTRQANKRTVSSKTEGSNAEGDITESSESASDKDVEREAGHIDSVPNTRMGAHPAESNRSLSVTEALGDVLNATPIPRDEETGLGHVAPEPPVAQQKERRERPDGGEPDEDETYRRWETAYEHTDQQPALQAQSQTETLSTICVVCFELLITGLIVGKLDKVYENDDPNDTGYSAFLIYIVPAVLAVVLSLCSCIIFWLVLLREWKEFKLREAERRRHNRRQYRRRNVVEEPPPMQAGKTNPYGLTFSSDIDTFRADLTNEQRVQVLAGALPISTLSAQQWLVEFEKTHNVKKITLWSLVMACANHLDCKNVRQEDVDELTFDFLGKGVWPLLKRYLDAQSRRPAFQSELDAVGPLPDDSENIEEGIEGMTCPVCFERYEIDSMVYCDGEPMHFFCRKCFHRYATETIQSGGISGIPCANPRCKAMFSTDIARANLSDWDKLRIEERENERNTRVALAAKAVLKCTCGAIGVVKEEDVGDGCITCPGPDCGLEYCVECGNKWHPDTNCPPPKEMLKWMLKSTRPCPNCHTPIEKNFGCDHMYCAPPAGCGHHFSYRTGESMSSIGFNSRDLFHGELNFFASSM